MSVEISKSADFDSWISLAREVEPLFGPMIDELDFHSALKQAIFERVAFCIYPDLEQKDKSLIGGIVISKEANEIVWLAVSQKYRRNGYGKELIGFAINNLNSKKNIYVQTFDSSVSEGLSARQLYLEFGFFDYKDGGKNPAGIQTVIMELETSKSI